MLRPADNVFAHLKVYSFAQILRPPTINRYDGNDRLIERDLPSVMTDSKGRNVPVTQVTHWKYDALGRLIRMEDVAPKLTHSDPSVASVIEYRYNSIGRLVERAIKKEVNGQVAEIQDDSNFGYERELDAALLSEADNETMNLSFAHENTPPFAMTGYQTHAAKTGNPLGLIEGSFTLTPDVTAGNYSYVQDGTGRILGANYDPAGRLLGLNGTYNGHGLTFALGHDGFGRTASISPSTGPLASFAYDVLNRPTQLAWSGNNTNVSENLTYDPFTGDVSAIDREIGHFAYSYDPLDQLEDVTYSGSSQLGQAASRGFSYDETGNRVSDTLRGQGQFWNNVLLGDAMASDLTDAQGRLLQRNRSDGSIEQFSYRVDGRLLHYQKRVPGFESPVVASDYEYDALDRRVLKRVGEGSIAVSQAYSYLGASDKILEGKAGDGTITLYMDAQGIDEHLGEIGAQGGKVFIRDHLGSVLNSDASGGAGVFGAFGEGLGSSVNLTAAADPVSYGFTGRQLDPESGLYYYRARMYDPATGRFVSEDPIGFGGGDGNLYGYVENNPVFYVDSFGMYRFAPGAQGPLTSGLDSALQCFEKCAGQEVTVTSGVRPDSSGPHGNGNACDLGRRANPWLGPDTAKSCYQSCFNVNQSYAQEEQNNPDIGGTHYHLQNKPGRGGATGFASTVRPYQP